jgi:hypothetical protein
MWKCKKCGEEVGVRITAIVKVNKKKRNY